MEQKTLYCQACLSRERKLTPVKYFKKILAEISLGTSMKQGGICWECSGIIRRFSKFKNQVKLCQSILQHSVKNEGHKSLSSLSNALKCVYDAEFIYNHTKVHERSCDDVKIEIDGFSNNDNEAVINLSFKDDAHIADKVTETIENKTEFEEVTLNNDPLTHTDDLTDSEGDSNDKDDRNDEIEAVIKNQSAKDEIDVSDKYTKIELSEEEMLKNRESKRNGPNYKKLPYKCDSCVLGFTKTETYDQHVKRKHDETAGSHTCAICKTVFATNYSLMRHKAKHYVFYKCNICKYETVELWSMLGHCKARHKNDTRDRIHCELCDVVCQTQSELTDHVREQHTITCDICGEKFKWKSSIRAHMRRIHAPRRALQCSTCGRRFASRSRLEAHVAAHGGADAARLAYCAQCRVQYKDLYVYRNHLRNSARHATELYNCTVCTKKFASKAYLKRHINFFHLKKSRYKCENCNKIFISQSSLKKHRQLHHGMPRTRNYDCSVCGKKFFTSSTLKGHMLIHSEERSYMCSECGDTFKQWPSLYTHVKLVHKREKRKCKT